MPNAPENKKRSWVPERVAFGRRNDNSKFYNARKWRKVSKAYREAHPLCEVCEAEGGVGHADVCDHTKGLQYLLDNNQDPYNWDELKSMCHKCHNKKSGKDSRKKRG